MNFDQSQKLFNDELTHLRERFGEAARASMADAEKLGGAWRETVGRAANAQAGVMLDIALRGLRYADEQMGLLQAAMEMPASESQAGERS